MYFHYLPSVFQLHMHVRQIPSTADIGPDSTTRGLNFDRIHMLRHVLRNLERDGTWYSTALIMTPSLKNCRTNMRKPSMLIDSAKKQCNTTYLLLAGPRCEHTAHDHRQWLGEDSQGCKSRRFPGNGTIHAGMRVHRRTNQPDEVSARDHMEAIRSTAIRQTRTEEFRHGRRHCHTCI